MARLGKAVAMVSDNSDRIFEEEHPGAFELESALFKDTLRDVLSDRILLVAEETRLGEVIRLMRERRQGCALVTRNGRLAGIFTERDVLMKIVGMPVDLERTAVAAYMTPDPVTLPADAIVAHALNKMAVEGFRHVPLVDAEGRPAGVVSMRDIIEHVAGYFPKDVLNLPPEPGKAFRAREGA